MWCGTNNASLIPMPQRGTETKLSSSSLLMKYFRVPTSSLGNGILVPRLIVPSLVSTLCACAQIKVSNHVEFCGCVPLWHSGCVQWHTWITIKIEMASCATFLCCVCWAAVPIKHMKLASWYIDLLYVTVTENDGLPKHICVKCVRQLGSLERATEDLVNFCSQAVESYRALHHIKHEE